MGGRVKVGRGMTGEGREGEGERAAEGGGGVGSIGLRAIGGGGKRERFGSRGLEDGGGGSGELKGFGERVEGGGREEEKGEGGGGEGREEGREEVLHRRRLSSSGWEEDGVRIEESVDVRRAESRIIRGCGWEGEGRKGGRLELAPARNSISIRGRPNESARLEKSWLGRERKSGHERGRQRIVDGGW